MNVTIANVIPVLTNPADDILLAGSTGNNLTCVANDVNTTYATYSINRTGLGIVQSGNWSAGVPIVMSLDSQNLVPGTYYFQIQVADGFGGYQYSTVKVTVTNNLPTLVASAGLSFPFGTQGQFVSWNVTDDSVRTGNATYYITQNGLVKTTGTWVSGQSINYSLASLAVGTYTFQLTVNDGFGGLRSSTIKVKVVNVVSTITSPADLTYTEGDTGNFLTWVVTDLCTSTISVIITQNGAAVVSTTWTSGSAITINVDGLAAGTYTYTIIAGDIYGGVVVSSVAVTVNAYIPDTGQSGGLQGL